MDFNESFESGDKLVKNVINEKNNTTLADFISSASEEKTTAIGFHDFSDSNGRISDCNRDDIFHSIETDGEDIMSDNIGTVNSNTDKSPDDNLNKNAEANEGLSVTSQSKLNSCNLVCDEKNVEKDDSELSFTSGELINQDNTKSKFVKSNISTQEMATEDENAATDDFFDDRVKDSPTNTECHAVENLVRPSEREKSRSNDVAKTKTSYDPRTTDDDFRMSIVDEADESFSLEEILEESECSDKDQTRVNSSNDEHLAFEEDSMASIQADNSDSLILENDDESTTEFYESPSNDEPADSLEIEDHPIRQEVVKDIVTVENVENNLEENVENNDKENVENNFEENVENNFEENAENNFEENVENNFEENVENNFEENVENNFEENVDDNSEENDATNFEVTGEDILSAIVSCPVSSSTDNIAPEKSKNDGKSPSKNNSSEAVANEAEIIDSSSVTYDITIESSPSKSQQQENSPSKHHLRSSVVPLEGGDQRSDVEDSTCHENSTEVLKDKVPSSHGDSIPSGESMDALPSVSDIQYEEEALRENNKTTELSTNPEERSLMEDLASDSTQDLLNNLRRRVSSRRRNNSDGSEPTLSDASLPGESGSSIMTVETCNKTNNHRILPNSTSRSPCSRSSWQPKINDVKSASSRFSLCLKKFSEDSVPDAGIKEEVIDESYEMDCATKERFNLVDFSIKLEKIAMDSDVEIISPPRKSRPAARRSLDNNSSSRSRSRSAMLENRMRSRTATNRSRPSATTSSARRPAKNQRRVDEPLSTKGAARGDGKSGSRLNGQTAKKSAAKRPADNRRRNNAQASAKNSTQTDNDHGRSLRSAGNDEDRDRIDFLSIFNLRSRQANSDEKVKGILVKPKINRVRSKKVSFHLPGEGTASTKRNDSSSKGGNSSKPSKGEDSSKSAVKSSSKFSKGGDSSSKSAVKVSSSRPSKVDSLPQLQIKVPPLIYFKEDSSSKSAVKVPSRSADRKRNVPTQSNGTSVPTPAKRRRSSIVPEKEKSEDEVIDEHPFDKLEELVDAARRTVDVWFECQCCNQKYYLIENAKSHVRTHFPNCLTN